MPKASKQRNYEDAKERQISQAVCVADLVKVISFDPSTMTVDVKPLVKYPDEEKFQAKPPVLAVPTAPLFGGGFVIRPWYEPGDIGVVIYLDRDSDAALKKGEESAPNTERLHSGDDAVFLGGILAGEKRISGHPAASVSIGTLDGSVFLSIGKDGVSIKGNMKVDGDVKITKDCIAGDISLQKHLHEPDNTRPH